jgi:hypothetical protein
MNLYPPLSKEAHEDPKQQRLEIVETMTNMAADVWRYYNGQHLTENTWDMLHKAIDEVTPNEMG